MEPELVRAIARSITDASGQSFEIQKATPCGGGCINQAVVLSSGSDRYFIKLNAVNQLAMFEAEAAALEALHHTATIRVSQPLTSGTAGSRAYLILEAIDFGQGSTADWHQMGKQLAAMHRHTHASYGWHRDNTIGSTAQHNTRTTDWATFLRVHRLGFQFQLARRNGFHFDQAEALLDAIPEILNEHTPEPSLLHGDLWSGNAGFTTQGEPIIFDPATYHGDRETDLAFSEYFGGFPPAFYQSYQETWALAPGYEIRKVLYNLYHVLNHANLFGGSYTNEAQRMIHQLLK